MRALPAMLAAPALAVALSACSDLLCDPDISLGCEEEKCAPAPADCLRSAPDLNVIALQVSSPRPARVTVYRGRDHETGVSVWSGTAPLASWSMGAETGAYSATALYVRGDDTVMVVDGDYLEAAGQATCEGTCFAPGSIALDLRLKD